MNRLPTYAGVFLVAMSTLVLEILITRITSVVAWYHLAFFVISLAMLGMTAGAIAVFLAPGFFGPVRARMAQFSVALAVGAPVSIAIALMIKLEPVVDVPSFLRLLGFGSALAVPFGLGGVVLTLALTRAGLPPGLVYGVDLVGAAAGCVLVIPLLQSVDAPSGVLIASAVAAGAGGAFAADSTGGPLSKVSVTRWRRLAGTIAVVALGLGFANAGADEPPLRPRWIKGLPEAPSMYAFTGWNTYSRVTVDKTYDLPPALWAPARTLPLELIRMMPQRAIKIDGAAGTMMARFDTRPEDGKPGHIEDHRYLAWDVTSFAHRMRPTGPAAVIGVGGGRDVLEAIRVGHRPVVGIELNEMIVALHREIMPEFSGVAALEGVELVTDEARSFLTRDDRRYSVITMSLIDTWAATGAGAYALSENGLYTVEGWQIFLRRLDEHGIFTVSRWYKPKSPGETGRMLALAMEALYSIGAKDPQRHIIMLQNLNIATLLVSPSPFSKADVDTMQKEAVLRGFNMIVTPRRLPTNPTLKALASQKSRDDLWAWARSQDLDYTPPTDERPFFFNMLKPSTWFRQPEAVDELDHTFLGNLHATQTLAYATGVSALLTFFAVIVPLWWQRKSLKAYGRADVWAACGYFALIGLGFMFVEMALLSRLNVFLGHPTIALAVLLGGIIFFTGVGSLLSGRVDVTKARVARGFPLVPAIGVLAAAAGVDPIMAALGGSSAAVRVLLSIALVGLPALGMGLGFPLGMRLITSLTGRPPDAPDAPDGQAGRSDNPDLGPWMWGINGACGVVASGLALATSMVWGIGTTLLVGAGCYLALPVCTAILSRGR